MAVPADTLVGFSVATVPVEPPRPDSIERAAMDGPVGDMTIVRPSKPSERDAATRSIRSQSAVSDVPPNAFGATIVGPTATMDPAVSELLRADVDTR